ncbi:DUF4351 domain-containing protein [Stenomitos frigidus]|uniref:DUF4351 domain-containing protein n=1 Tax=Stenomitos frigidus TaxID=1886765 RepID=UPI003D662A3A
MPKLVSVLKTELSIEPIWADSVTIVPGGQDVGVRSLPGNTLGRSPRRGLTLILRRLKCRFGTIDESVQSQVTTLPSFKGLGEALLDFSEPADLSSWLQKTSRLSNRLQSGEIQHFRNGLDILVTATRAVNDNARIARKLRAEHFK